jgi:uncharacterized hydrophobic protein (TIGR00271 family)
MLISPLMTPILSLGMGLAVGSPLLVIRSAARIVASVAIVVGSASVVTLLLPIHEVTSEISSRTSPTVLDLAIASCCAVAGLYAVIRPGSDTASAAAGTSIGIALVPPLCVVGYGIGTSSLSISAGAALLFTANFCAILFLSVLGFVVLGYGAVAVGPIEREHAGASAAGGVTARLARRMSIFFASRFGPAVRIAMPLFLVLAVYWPLSTALVEVRWEIRVRNAVKEALQGVAEPSVHSSVRVGRSEVSVRLVTVGSEADAERLRTLLTKRIVAAAGVEPTVTVVAVPDAKALARAEAALRDRPMQVAPAEPAHADLARVRREADAALGGWPSEAAGPLLAWRISFAHDEGAATVEVIHLGRPLGAAAESLLARSLSNALHDEVRLRDVVFDAEPLVAARLDGTAWLPHAAYALGRLRDLPSGTNLRACIDTPAGRDVAPVADALHAAAAALADTRVAFTTGDSWALRWSTTPCAGTTADAGPDDAGLAADGPDAMP